MKNAYLQDLERIRRESEWKDDENDAFKVFLGGQNASEIDKLVFSLNDEVSPAIDCTSCGNCCRSLMINVEPGEPEKVALRLGLTTGGLKKRYIEESEQGRMVINAIPCHFLENSKCTIYEDRFSSCREFPHLHRPGFSSRLFSTFMHYSICPIIFNVVEELKNELSFTYSDAVAGIQYLKNFV